MKLNIEMSKKKAQIFFPDGSHLSGHFFVLLHAQGRVGGECLLDLLLDERSYLPFEMEGGQVQLFQKGSIVMVRSEGCQYLQGVSYQRKMNTRIIFLSGQTLEGKVYSDLPQSKSRLSDFLNHSRRFFCLEADGNEYLVNAQFIKSVDPSQTS
jgi:hypothetical protein